MKDLRNIVWTTAPLQKKAYNIQNSLKIFWEIQHLKMAEQVAFAVSFTLKFTKKW
jgi:hypothetical protein